MGKARWELAVKSHLLYALIQRYQTHKHNSEELMDQTLVWVLRHDPSYQITWEVFSPGTKARFERLRKQVEKEKRTRLEVKSRPTGAGTIPGWPVHGQDAVPGGAGGERVPGGGGEQGGDDVPAARGQHEGAAVAVRGFQFESAIHPERRRA